MNFSFTITQARPDLLHRYPAHVLDGDLIILINDQVFFNEPGIALLDLALAICNWLKSVEAGHQLDFDYSPDDFEENPVLHLTRLDSHYYGIHSAVVENFADTILGLGEITRCLRCFLLELDSEIQKNYGIAFIEIPAFNGLI